MPRKIHTPKWIFYILGLNGNRRISSPAEALETEAKEAAERFFLGRVVHWEWQKPSLPEISEEVVEGLSSTGRGLQGECPCPSHLDFPLHYCRSLSALPNNVPQRIVAPKGGWVGILPFFNFLQNNKGTGVFPVPLS